MKKKIIVLLVLLFVAFILLSTQEKPQKENSFKQSVSNIEESSAVLNLSGNEISVEIVDTEELRTKGLGGREILEDNTGMFFVFNYSDKYGIWMKDMKFAIDILWIDEDGIIVDIKENISPETYPEVFYPSVKARYVLEVNEGFVKEKGVGVGETVLIKDYVN
jgi:uncharacterized membrane protein (UPF0127 family)